MGFFDDNGYFTRGEKRHMQAVALVPIGLLIILIGVSVNVWYIWVFGAVCFSTGFGTAYKSIKARRTAKRIAREEAEIRAYQLHRMREEDARMRRR